MTANTRHPETSKSNTYKRWFSRVVWLGIGVNIYFSALTILIPNRLVSFLGLQSAEPTVWLSFSGNLLILLSLFYILAAVDPDRYRPAAWLAVFSRFAGVVFFGAMVVGGQEQGLIRFALADSVFGISELILLWLAVRSERVRRIRSESEIRWTRILAGTAVVLIAVLGSTAWFYFLREVPQTFDSIEQRFLYGSIGAEQTDGVPYWMWVVLPRIFPEKLPGPGGYVSLGVVWEEGREMPIGFSKKTVGFDRVAINCAFCHTATVRTAADAERVIYPAGPSHQFNPQGYQRFLFESARDPEFTADRIMDELKYLYEFSWIESFLYRYAIVPYVRRVTLDLAGEWDWTYDATDWGHGRIDPFNPVKFRMLGQPFDSTIGNSDMPPIWNLRAREGMSFHWDGLNTVLPEVTRSSALGDGATLDSIPIDDLDAIESWLLDLPAPGYPFPVDLALAAEGAAVYEENCASCHAFDGERTGTVIPLAEVETDRHRLDMWTEGSADAYNDFTAGEEWDFSGFVKTNGYVSPPLDAVWIRAPFLHNGSVPTLRDLLEPPENRPDSFYRGYDVYDPADVGFVSDVPSEGSTPFTFHDTSEPANGNEGHLWGTDLDPDLKDALLEYLKTL
jgi:hypothetical protein